VLPCTPVTREPAPIDLSQTELQLMREMDRERALREVQARSRSRGRCPFATGGGRLVFRERSDTKGRKSCGGMSAARRSLCEEQGSPTLKIIYDVPGWAFHNEALALCKYAPPDFEVSLDLPPQHCGPNETA